jgi:diguanylate cyclase (GGDEF)-like protein
MRTASEDDDISDERGPAGVISIAEPAQVARSVLSDLLAGTGAVAAVLRSADRSGPSVPVVVFTAGLPAPVQAALAVDPLALPAGTDLTCMVIRLAVALDTVSDLTLVHGPEMNARAAREQVAASAMMLTLASVAAGFRPIPGAVFNRFGVDALTGRPDREFALMHLSERLCEEDLSFAVLFCDLDGFKTVNDTLGHGVGDALLRQVAERLAGTLVPSDTLARLGGDEFLAIVHAPTLEVVERQATALIESLNDDFTVGAHTVSVGVSIGIALPTPEMTADELISAADIAMYEAKKLRSGASALYTPALHAQMERRRTLEHDLRHAIERKELSIRFQPVIHLRSGVLSGVETLLRWAHPTIGEVTPATFIPLAENTRLIDDLGRFALTEGLCEFVRLKERHGPAAPGYVAVNVSRYQLNAPDFVSHLSELVARFGIHPSELHLELTESAALLDATSARTTLMAVTGMGIGLDIDDFGSGYSSLAYLTRLPSLNAIKLDSSMIWQLAEDKRAQVTVRALIGLVHQLGLHLLAEGIETPWQRDWLQENGCDLGQGFALGAPMPPSVLSGLLDSSEGTARSTVPRAVK